MAKVLVIGGTGVISTEIVNRLCALSHEVTVFNRGLRKVRYQGSVECITGDKKDEAGFRKLLLGRRFNGVIDMISYNPEDAALTLDALGALNHGSENKGGSENRGGHFIFTSTVAAYKRPVRNIPVIETNELFDNDKISPYGYHKARMEAFLQIKMADIPITIIRPSLTFGTGCRNVGIMRNNYGIIRRLQQGKPIVVFGDGTNPWAWTFAPDLAKAYAGVLCRPACFGQIYHATSDDRHIWDDLYLEFGRLTGTVPHLVHISTEMLMRFSEAVFSHVYQEKMHCGIFDNSKILRDVPEFTIDYPL
ncbi:MAG: NAD-dependent epimerase/dehydratase family protein, partial [Treponema sp.]|nr:NAD-dependent epimerase/dehydratase family protein [Treponema sp.]